MENNIGNCYPGKGISYLVIGAIDMLNVTGELGQVVELPLLSWVLSLAVGLQGEC